VGWSSKGIFSSKGGYFEIKKQQNLKQETNVSFKGPPNRLKNVSQMCLGFSTLN
jgi:hypothetical protein